MAMPWSRAKQIRRALLGQDEFPKGYIGSRTRAELTALFDACFRIQREAGEAAGHHIPMVVENVRGANEWVGRSRWNFGSFHLWGDVPALMPITRPAVKVNGIDFNDFKNGKGTSPAFNDTRHSAYQGVKVASESGHRTDRGKGARFASQDCGIEGTKQPGIYSVRENGKGDAWFQDGSKSNTRKHASAQIAKIPLVLARHIAKVYKP